jgi:hypothetical protein
MLETLNELATAQTNETQATNNYNPLSNTTSVSQMPRSLLIGTLSTPSPLLSNKLPSLLSINMSWDIKMTRSRTMLSHLMPK